MNAMLHDELVVPDHRAIVSPLYEEVHVVWSDHDYHVTSTRLASEPDCHCYPDYHHVNVTHLPEVEECDHVSESLRVPASEAFDRHHVSVNDNDPCSAQSVIDHDHEQVSLRNENDHADSAA